MRKKPGLFRPSTILMATAFIGVFVLLLGLRTNVLLADSVEDNVRDAVEQSVVLDEEAFSIAAIEESETGLYVIRLQDKSLAAYEGGVAGLAATNPRVAGKDKLDVTAPESVAYLNYLREKHDEFIGAMENSLGRSVEVEFQYLNVLNALAVRVDHAEAQRLATLPGVLAVYPDQIRELQTDVGPTLIGAPTFWEGDFGHGEHRGEGVIIGFLDTGVNPEHPSFAEVSPGDGYVHDNPYGSGNFVGVCDPTEDDYDEDFPCNDKLIGAWNFHPNSPGAWDWHAHGSHVGSTIGGNLHDAVVTVGTDTFTRTISGVAPRANAISYLVCYPSCPSTSSVAATNQAIADGVDVLNYSISGGDDPWNDMVDLAFLDATEAGMFVSASAGNDGPGPSTVAKTGPWNAAVAASTHNRVIANTVDATAPTQPPELQGMAAVHGTGVTITVDIESDIIWAGDVDVDNIRGCDPFPADSFDGAIAVIQRGDCTFETKVNNADDAGAIAVIVYNHVGGPPTVMGGLEDTAIPAVMIDQVDGDNLAAFASANPGDAEARISAATSVVENDDWQDILAGFSSRGPSQFDLLKPDYTAPGVNILAAGWDGPDHYVFMGGTSMSSPHGAGAAALLVQRHPTWTPAEVKSALAMTAWQDLLKEDGVTPADFFDMGSGRVDLTMAAQIGLVMDETIANYEAANPEIGGDPKTLNQPSMVNQRCPEVCEWTRTVRSTLSSAATYTATIDAPAGITVTIDPPVFTIPAGGTQTFTVTVDATGQPYGDWHFAQVSLDGGADVAPDVIWEEGFEDTTFPPAGWSHYVQGDTGAMWARTSASSYSGDASAYHNWDSSNDVDNWLVTPTFTVTEGAELHFYERGTFMGWYVYSGVWLSTDSCDPADGDFVELYEVPDTGNFDWRLIAVDLSAYDGEEVCVAFRYSGLDAHAWYIDDVAVLVPGDEAPTVAPVRLPIAFIPVEPAAGIFLSPSAVSSTQAPDEVVTSTLAIHNVGALDLDWELFQLSGNTTHIATIVPGVIWDQPRVGSSGRINNFSNPDDTGIYQSSPFVLFTDVEIDYIFAEGFYLGGSLADATALNWYIYEDVDGSPAGNPEDGQDLHVWSYTANVGDPGVDISDNNMTLDLTAAGETPVALGSGIYWILAYPDIPIFSLGPNILYAWFHSGTGTGQQIGPGGLIGFPTSWSNVPEGRAFRLEGQIDCTESDISWLDAAPTSGTVMPGGRQDVTLTFDSTGLWSGEYTAALCLLTNDPHNEVVLVPATLNVEADPVINVSPDMLADTLDYGLTATHTITISNTGLDTLEWSIEEAASPMAMLTSEVLFDQTANTTTSGALAIYDLDEPETWAVQAADDFRVPANETWTIETVFAAGFYGGLINAPTEVNVFFYEDDNGLPGDEIYSAPDLMPSEDDAGDLTLDLPTPLVLSGGHYWVSVQPKMDFFGDGRWFWSMESVQTYNEFAWRNPGNGYGTGCTDWTPGSVCGFTNPDLTFQLIGTSIDQCGDLQDLPWVSVYPDSGMTDPGESDMVSVMLDANGLANGVYTGNLCIASNDPATPLTYVPVELTVENAPDANLRVAHLAPFAMDPGTAVTVTLNATPVLTDFHFSESTSYLSVPAGEHEIAIYVGGSVTPTLVADVMLVPGVDYSAIAVGGANGWPVELNLYEDDNTAPAAGFGHVRFGHLAPFTAVITDTLADIRTNDGDVVVASVPYGTLAGYMPLEAGEYDLQVTSVGGDIVYIDLAPFTLNDGDILYAVAVGDGDNQALGVFAWPTDTEGFLLPLAPDVIYLPIIFRP